MITFFSVHAQMSLTPSLLPTGKCAAPKFLHYVSNGSIYFIILKDVNTLVNRIMKWLFTFIIVFILYDPLFWLCFDQCSFLIPLYCNRTHLSIFFLNDPLLSITNPIYRVRLVLLLQNLTLWRTVHFRTLTLYQVRSLPTKFPCIVGY